MKEFIEELKYNQNINYKKGLENRVDIDYVIERLIMIYSTQSLFDAAMGSDNLDYIKEKLDEIYQIKRKEILGNED